MEGVLFEFYRGDTYSRDFVITGYSLPISKVYFTVKENVEDKKASLQKTLNNGITLVEESEDTKAYNLLINSTDTDDMKADYNYVFDIEKKYEPYLSNVKLILFTDTAENICKRDILRNDGKSFTTEVSKKQIELDLFDIAFDKSILNKKRIELLGRSAVEIFNTEVKPFLF